MTKMILMDGAELMIEDGASIGSIGMILSGYSALEEISGKLTDANLKSVNFASDENVVGVYADMTLSCPHFSVTRLCDGKIKVVFGLRAKTREELQQSDLQTAIAYLSDEQAITVPGLYPDWKPVGDYQVGNRCRYNGGLYKCLQTHTSQDDWMPNAAPSLWAPLLIPENPEVIPQWQQPDSTNGYAAGDKVTHDGEIWESLVDNNIWEPGITGTEALWKVVE